MSNAIYPVLPGLGWSVIRSPQWNTIKQRMASGREVRVALFSYPIWNFQLVYNILRGGTINGADFAEYQTLLNFFNARLGPHDSFLFDDPTDNAVFGSQFGTGDAVTTAFQLTRLLLAGGFLEPVKNLNGAAQIFRNDWQGNQLMYATPRTNLLLRSEDFTASWVTTRASIVSNSTTAPDGNATADTLKEDATASNSHFVAQSVNITNLLNYELSVWAKTGPGSKRWMVINSDFRNVAFEQAFFDLSNGTVSQQAFGGTAAIVAYPNGWYRCSVSGPGRATASVNTQFMLANAGSGAAFSYNGDNVSGNFLFGSQMEPSAAMTSYLKTVGAPVTSTDYSIDTLGMVTFSIAPLLAAVLTWTGNYYYRCRFSDDSVDFENFLYQLYSLNKVKLIGSLGDKI